MDRIVAAYNGVPCEKGNNLHSFNTICNLSLLNSKPSTLNDSTISLTENDSIQYFVTIIKRSRFLVLKMSGVDELSRLLIGYQKLIKIAGMAISRKNILQAYIPSSSTRINSANWQPSPSTTNRSMKEPSNLSIPFITNPKRLSPPLKKSSTLN